MADNHYDVALIGAGIMSATLGTLLMELDPNLKVVLFERLDEVGAESSDAWNNAGTGHAAYCELNYTPINDTGEVDLGKALRITESFEVSKQFWSYLRTHQLIHSSNAFINDIPHMSFVMGDEHVAFLKKRYAAMSQFPAFADMILTEDHAIMQDWIPLMMEGRSPSEKLAATRMEIGTDVNFGALTRAMVYHLQNTEGIDVFLGHEVRDLKELKNKNWRIKVKDLERQDRMSVTADFVFIGAGGGALPLLDESGIPEGRGYGGFPVSGQWLRCHNPEVIERHEAKVYGKASVGSPPMSVPHLDTRMMNGQRSLLFGPYAGFSTKFLKNGSYFDLPLSLEAHNLWPMLSAGAQNIDLTKYLVKQVLQSPEDRFKTLQTYYPEAQFDDWQLEIAGQRVQIIKKDDKGGGVLKFGTEIVKNQSGSLAALLGASPGASTSVSIMINVLEQCFPQQMKSTAWRNTLLKMIPTYGQSLIDNASLLAKTREYTSEVLKLED